MLGPNGAGKSTTLRMLTTLIAAHRRARRGRRPRRRRRTRRRSGGRSATSARATARATASAVRDELVSQGRCYGLDRADARRRADELLDALDLDGPGRPQGVRASPAASAAGSTSRSAWCTRRAAVPRRAVDRPRPAEPGQPVGAHPALRAEHGDDDRAHHALPGRGRLDGRAGRRRRPRPGHRRRHRRPAQGRRSPATGSCSASPHRADAERLAGAASGCPAPGRRASTARGVRVRVAGRAARAARCCSRGLRRPACRSRPPRCTAPPSTTSSSPSPAAACARAATVAKGARHDRRR